MILAEKSTQNEVVLIMAGNSVGMRHKTQFMVLLLPEGSDQSCLCVLDQSIQPTQTSIILQNFKQLKMHEVCLRSFPTHIS